MTFVFLLALVAVGAAAAPPPQTAPKGPLRILVQTDEIGGDLVNRQASATDLSAALAAKKKVFLVVDTEERAEVIVDVLDRTVDTPKVVIGIGARPGSPPGTPTGPARTVRLRASVKYAEETTTLTNKNSPLENQRGWKSAAEDLAKQIEQWIAARSKR
jgi:hypothetical protein